MTRIYYTHLKEKIYRLFKKINRIGLEAEWLYFRGSWSQALKSSTGYEAKNILERVYESSKKVKLGEVAYERDSVIFQRIQHNWPFLASLGMLANEFKGKLNIIDFGGSLGTSYYGAKGYFKNNIKFNWIILEQPSFVRVGKREFSNDELVFIDDLDKCETEEVHLVILSGVLQYIEDPKTLLKRIFRLNSRFILVDRTSIILDSQKRLVIQKVPKEIYEASYPCWLFNESEFLDLFENYYRESYSFDSAFDSSSLTLDRKKIIFKGYLFERV